jgi:hypothetical protein
MTIAQQFTAAYLKRAPLSPEPQLVPHRLAAATAEVTGIDGVGLGVFGHRGLAVPIGANSAEAVLAERLEFTVGQGPGYDAHGEHRMVVATEPVMAARWPAYHDLLLTRTSFRSVVALPLTGPLESMAIITLLFHDPSGASAPPTEIEVLCRYITAALIEADLLDDTGDIAPLLGVDTDSGPVWLSGPSSVVRNQVMAAVGMLSEYLGISRADGLKLLKSRAYGQHSTTDQIAAALLAGDLALAAFDLEA